MAKKARDKSTTDPSARKIIAGDYTPEQQRAIIKRMKEGRAVADKAREVIDRAAAIRDGLIPPLWVRAIAQEKGLWTPDGGLSSPHLQPELVRQIGYTPEQQRAIKRMKECRAFADIIDRAAAIRDGLILRELHKHKGTTKSKAKPKLPEGAKSRAIRAIAQEKGLWTPDSGFSSPLLQPELVRQIGNAYEKRYGGATVSRNQILRALGLQSS
jgi:hypothetical protein